MKTVHLLIKGKVQGVFYRATAKKVGDKLHLTGWVRNTEKGDVEAMVSGEEKKVEEFILWCKTGPEKAEVEDVIITEKEIQSFNNFEIQR